MYNHEKEATLRKGAYSSWWYSNFETDPTFLVTSQGASSCLVGTVRWQHADASRASASSKHTTYHRRNCFFCDNPKKCIHTALWCTFPVSLTVTDHDTMCLLIGHELEWTYSSMIDPGSGQLLSIMTITDDQFVGQNLSFIEACWLLLLLCRPITVETTLLGKCFISKKRLSCAAFYNNKFLPN